MSRKPAEGDLATFGTTRYVNDKDVAVLQIDNPPSNALSFQIRCELLKGLQRACDDPSVRAIVVVGSERAFCSGADIRQFDTPSYYAYPRTWHLAQAIEAAEKPVIAAIGGFAMGGGLEIALAAHSRVAAAGSKLGLPEVKLGVIPAAGGILRLPRLVGVARAYELITEGNTFTAEEAQEWGLIDLIYGNEIIERTKEYSKTLIDAPLRRTLSLHIEIDTSVQSFSERLQSSGAIRHDPARGAIARCFDALLSEPTDVVDRLVRQCSEKLVASKRAKALRYQFMSQREVARVGARATLLPVEVVAVGGIDAQLAGRLASAGIPIHAADADLTLLPHRRVVLIELLPESHKVALRRLSSDSLAGIATREPSITQEILAGISAADKIVEFGITKPDHGQGVFEIVQRSSTPPEVTKALVEAAKRMNYVPVLTFRERIIPRLEGALQIAFLELIKAGVEKNAIHAMLVGWGFSSGTVERLLRPLSHQGDERAVWQNAVPKDNIVGHCVAALGREGARLVAEKVAPYPASVDIVAVFGLSFPPERGGPMFEMSWQGSGVAEIVS
jgi:enoyl-CoA hydratase/carnithine racemase